MDMENSCYLSCKATAALLDNGTKAGENPALAAHLAGCAECRALARIMELSASLAAEVPAGMTDSVMRCIRTERAKQASRMRWIRRIGTAAAAAVLVPAVVIFAPILFGAKDAASPEMSADRTAEEIVAADTHPQTAAVTVEPYTDTAVPPVLMMSPPPALNTSIDTSDNQMTGSTTAAESVPPVGAAPSHVTKDTAKTQSSVSYGTMAADDPSPVWQVRAVLAVLIGTDAAAVLADEDYAAAAQLCRTYAVSRTDFLDAAAALNAEISAAELDLIFG